MTLPRKWLGLTGRIFQKLLALSLSGLAGLLVPVLILSPVISLAYFFADDGPFFPPPMVAFGFVALPFAVLLLPLQLLVVLVELIASRKLGLSLAPLALLSGLAASLIWDLALHTSQADILFFLAITGLALLQSALVFTGYWVLDGLAPFGFKLLQKGVQFLRKGFSF